MTQDGDLVHPGLLRGSGGRARADRCVELTDDQAATGESSPPRDGTHRRRGHDAVQARTGGLSGSAPFHLCPTWEVGRREH